jgi:hypothetical protein
MDVVGYSALTSLPLELIDNILSFLSWPFDLHPLLLVNRRLSSIAERDLYSNLGELPAQRSVRLLLSLANAPAARCELVKALKVNFTENRVLFALEVLIAKVLCLLPRLRTLIVEVSVHENKYRALAWIFPRDAPFRLRSFETSIRCASLFFLSVRALNGVNRLDPDLAAFLESQPEIRDLSLRGMPVCTSSPFTLQPSALPHLETFRSVHVDPDTLCEVSYLHTLSFPPLADLAPPQVIATRPVHGISLTLFLGTRIPRARGARAHIDARPATHNPHSRRVGSERTLPAARRASPTPRGATYRSPGATLRPRTCPSPPPPPPLFFPALRAFAPQETLLASSPLLEAFDGLRSLTFMATGASCYELDDEAKVAEHWARACPTLTTIILPKGRVWFAGSAGRWVHS